ncbi:MAG: FIG004556: membrane metalloprotease [uncultured Acetobacteraceae bacterium]|uniref:FIG004556: membrane metalloprotease n=1 Tax=uncultured Acetobacteraceae bacterium TaxID=169975 RepID=A0A6J4JPF1_9PROT|nr:MAG: FIG004556: membrane metalloprotease [uncultured Acetobacteraceae bacterium]
MTVLPTWLPELLAAVLASVVAITLHEAAHGYAALALGDDTAKRMGRLSLNPIRHVDPVGTVLVPGVLLVGQLLTLGRVEGMFGWAKPVPVNLRALRDPRRGMMLVAAAGPATNFALAWLAGLLVHPAAGIADALSLDSMAWVYRLLGLSILANLVLGLFNLLPIPPLDGGRIVAGLLPARLALPFMRLEPFGILLVMGAVFVLPRVADGFDPVGWALRTVVADGFNLVLLLSFHGGGRA